MDTYATVCAQYIHACCCALAKLPSANSPWPWAPGKINSNLVIPTLHAGLCPERMAGFTLERFHGRLLPPSLAPARNWKLLESSPAAGEGRNSGRGDIRVRSTPAVARAACTPTRGSIFRTCDELAGAPAIVPFGDIDQSDVVVR